MGRHYLDVLNKSELKKMVGAFQAELDQSESTIAALQTLVRTLGKALAMCEHPVQLGIMRAACPSRHGEGNPCWCGRTAALSAFEAAKKDGIV